MRPKVIIIQLILCVVGASIAINLAVWPLALISSARNENLEQIDLLCCSALTASLLTLAWCLDTVSSCSRAGVS